MEGLRANDPVTRQEMDALLIKVGALEAELKEMKGMLTQVLGLVTAMAAGGQSVGLVSNAPVGPSPLLELPVEIIQRILYYVGDRALYYASKTCTAMYNVSGSNIIWKDRFASKWPVFFETFLLEHKAREQKDGHKIPLEEGTYKRLFKDTSLGRRSWRVQVYKRDLNEGFRASFTDAMVSLDPFTLTYTATYSPNLVQGASVERGIESSRIRSVPPELWGFDRNQIWDGTPVEELAVGMSVEVQWAFTPELPLCWWYGEIAAIEDETEEEEEEEEEEERPEGESCRRQRRKRISLIFLQYPADSIWASATLSYPNINREVQPVRGFYGGIRIITRPQDRLFWENMKKTGNW